MIFEKQGVFCEIFQMYLNINNVITGNKFTTNMFVKNIYVEHVRTWTCCDHHVTEDDWKYSTVGVPIELCQVFDNNVCLMIFN